MAFYGIDTDLKPADRTSLAAWNEVHQMSMDVTRALTGVIIDEVVLSARVFALSA